MTFSNKLGCRWVETTPKNNANNGFGPYAPPSPWRTGATAAGPATAAAPVPPPRADIMAAIRNAPMFGEAYDMARRFGVPLDGEQGENTNRGTHDSGMAEHGEMDDPDMPHLLPPEAPILPAAAPAALPVYPAEAHDVSTKWEMPRHETYEPHLRSLMMFVHRHPDPYPKGTTFTKDQLLQLQPQHVKDWLSMKAFGKVDWRYEVGDRPKFY